MTFSGDRDFSIPFFNIDFSFIYAVSRSCLYKHAPNGAGKSTLMNMMTQNLKPDGGEILWNGKKIDNMGKDYRALLGYMPQQQNLYDSFTGEEFLWYMASLKGLSKKRAGERIDSLLGTVNLEHARYKRIQAYSGGEI